MNRRELMVGVGAAAAAAALPVLPRQAAAAGPVFEATRPMVVAGVDFGGVDVASWVAYEASEGLWRIVDAGLLRPAEEPVGRFSLSRMPPDGWARYEFDRPLHLASGDSVVISFGPHAQI